MHEGVPRHSQVVTNTGQSVSHSLFSPAIGTKKKPKKKKKDRYALHGRSCILLRINTLVRAGCSRFFLHCWYLPTPNRLGAREAGSDPLLRGPGSIPGWSLSISPGPGACRPPFPQGLETEPAPLGRAHGDHLELYDPCSLPPPLGNCPLPFVYRSGRDLAGHFSGISTVSASRTPSWRTRSFSRQVLPLLGGFLFPK